MAQAWLDESLGSVPKARIESDESRVRTGVVAEGVWAMDGAASIMKAARQPIQTIRGPEGPRVGSFEISLRVTSTGRAQGVEIPPATGRERRELRKRYV
jgi:hypothetical protein